MKVKYIIINTCAIALSDRLIVGSFSCLYNQNNFESITMISMDPDFLDI
jgi:hypothetical protein